MRASRGLQGFAGRHPGLKPATYISLAAWHAQSDPRSYGDLQNWKDLAGKGNHVEQATADKQPGIGGSPGLAGACRTFNGIDECLVEKVLKSYSVSPVNVALSLYAGEAFLHIVGEDLSPYAADSKRKKVVAYDSGGNVVFHAYIGAAGGGESLGTEQITDGDMETDPTNNWSVAGGALAEETTTVHGGAKSLKLTASVANGRAFQLVSLTAGKCYKGIGYITNDAGDKSRVRFTEWGGLGTQYCAGIFTDNHGSWAEQILYFTAENSGVIVYGYVESSGDVGYLDDYSVKPLLDCAATGVHLFDARSGGNQSVIATGPGDRNDIATIEITSGDFCHTGAFTQSWWVYCADPTNFVIADKLDANNKGFRIGIDGADKAYCSIGDGTDIQTATWGSAISANTWYLITAGYDGANAFIAVDDGAVVEQAQDAPADTDKKLQIGTDGSNYAEGNIAAGVDFAAALSDAERQRMYLAEAQRFGKL
jgi:hypothetical protein